MLRNPNKKTELGYKRKVLHARRTGNGHKCAAID